MYRGQYVQGKFSPKNPDKYLGDPSNIVFRSSWELRAFKFLDEHPKVLAWDSEETVIPYISPVDNRAHRYFMDLKVVVEGEGGKKEVSLVEIKPYSQTVKPRRGKKKKTETFLNEVKTWAVNEAKWNAAKAFCKDRGWSFKIWTERELFPQNFSLKGK